MPSRPAAILFVALCLGLCGLVLRRQFLAHPAPPRTSPARPAEEALPFDQSRPVDHRSWRPASGGTRRAVRAAILGQLAAIRAGDADRAMSYQSLSLRGNFASPQDFVGMIRSHYPEFARCRSAELGPMWADPSGAHADVTVTVHGENGRSARGDYRMVREGGGYRVAAVFGGQAIR